MIIERMAYIVRFYGKEVPKRLKKLDINLVYVSSKANYAIMYCDLIKGYKYLVNELRRVKGFISVEASLNYEETKNIKSDLRPHQVKPQTVNDELVEEQSANEDNQGIDSKEVTTK